MIQHNNIMCNHVNKAVIPARVTYSSQSVEIGYKENSWKFVSEKTILRIVENDTKHDMIIK